MATFAPEIVEKIKEVTGKTYAQQAQFYLNAFFNDAAQPAEKEAEEIWKLCIDFEKEDFAKGKNGSELNAVQAFNLLQKRDQTKTALELKKMLREVDLDSNGEMALFEYVIHFYKRCPKDAVTRPQGEVDVEKLRALEAKLEELNATFEKLTVQLEAEKVALEKAEAAEKAAIEQEAAAKAAEQVALDEEAKAKAAEQVALDEEAKAKAAEAEAIDLEEKATAATKILADAEAELRAVEDEANAIAEEIRKQEQAKIDEMARLDALTQDQTVGIVKRNMAVQQLAALKGEDSLPLQKAKLTQEAVVRKLKKATDAAAEKTAVAKVASDAATESRNAATAAANQAAAKRAEAVAARELAEQRRAEAVASREAAEAKRAEAVAAKQAAEESKKATEAAVAKCQADLEEVTKEFEVIKSQTGIPLGFEWWTARTLEDKKRSLPQRMW